MLMMACTPSSLRMGKASEEEKTGGVVSAPKLPAPALPVDSVSLSALIDSIGNRQDVDSLMAEVKDSLDAHPEIAAMAGALADSLTADEAPVDTMIPANQSSAIKTKRDTTQMDSLELAIYKYNKVIDDSLARDSINKSRKNGIDAPVEYAADDSLVYEAGTSRAFLFGNSKVKYQNMDQASENISMSLDSNLVYASGKMDSTSHQMVGTPVFKMGSDQYEQTEMMFNFKTKKGFITDVYTQQEDGYLTSELSKRGADGEMFLEHGRYTTCDDPHPDFYIAMSRAKVRPGKDVVFGPAYLVVADVPLPLAIPYGFFPFTKSYSSGLIMPTYGDETSRGFYLRDGGYYFAVSDKMDLKLLGEIYTKGSWGVSVTSNYIKRYRHRGSFLFSYQNSKEGEKNMPDYQETTSFKLQWNHTQDTKANPFRTFKASVNYASTSYERNNLSSMYNPQSLTQSQRMSSISMDNRFSSIGLSLSTTISANQNMRDSTVDLTLPEMSISIANFYPFKRKKSVGDERWYEKISMRYTGNLSNKAVKIKEDKLMHTSLSKDWQNGMSHSIPISASFTAFNYLSLTPSINFNGYTVFKKFEKSWDEENQKELTDTLTGFYNYYQYNMSLSAQTKLYGFYIPSRKIFGDKIQAIRHVLTPSVSFTYTPDFSAGMYGFYKRYKKVDKEGNESEVEYSPYSGGMYSAPSNRMSGSMSVSLGNNVEMKYKDKDDSLRLVSLIDDLTLRMSYDFAAKERPLSDLDMNIRIKLSKSYTFSTNARFASYVYEADSVGATPRLSTNTTYWEQFKWGRFQGMSQGINYTLDNNKIINFIKRLKGEKVDKKDDKNKNKGNDDEEEWDPDLNTNIDKDLDMNKDNKNEGKSKAETDEDGYMAFKMPWSLTFSYNINMRESTDVKKFNYDKMRYPYEFTQSLNFHGNIRLSDGWNINFNSGYDFDYKKISMTTASLSRDLHCFNMSCSVTLAPYTSYNFSFRCNASTLTDALKYDKRSSYSNAVQWY
jgi:hypothetical protein